MQPVWIKSASIIMCAIWSWSSLFGIQSLHSLKYSQKLMNGLFHFEKWTSPFKIYMYKGVRVDFLNTRGLHGWVVKVAYLRSQVPHRCTFDPHSGQNLLCEEAIQLAYGRSVVLPRCQLVPEIMPERGTLGLPPPIKAGKKSTKKSWRAALGCL
jgi:hypothetical protein